MDKGAGILLHISSLPSTQGIGCFSRRAYEFVDFLSAAGIKYWQVLPLNPTGAGDSPYSPLSVFAGNPNFIDLEPYYSDDELKKYNLLSTDDGTRVVYDNVNKNKARALKDLYVRGYDKTQFSVFIKDNKYWIEPFAEWMTVKFGYDKDYYIFTQMLFFEQWQSLKEYANSKGVKIIGDVPIYTSMDSADIWAYPKQFDITDGRPNGVAGVPPDYFNENGQLWGNPLYNFKQMALDKYKWWIERLKILHKMFDAVRIDHFRAFDTYYNIPFEAKTAKTGKWCKGPGLKFFNAIKRALPDIKIILEDLGDITKSVKVLRDQTEYPGMKVFQFGFDGTDNEHLPHNYTRNCVAYLGTHDNDTFIGFLKSAGDETKQIVEKYLYSQSLNPQDTARLAFESMMFSRADIVILTMQDLLFQGSESRMNIPGEPFGNWNYSLSSKNITADIAPYLRMLCEKSGRL